MALKMLGMNVLVKVTKEEKTLAGIIVPGTVGRHGPLDSAKVLGVGPGEYHFGNFVELKDVLVGDTVIIDLSFAKPFKYNGEECLIIPYAHVLGVDHGPE